MCFQYMILVHETYELQMNEFCMISITKSWDAKFMMLTSSLSYLGIR